MPEANQRRAVLGLKQAQEEFSEHVAARLVAEGGAEKIDRDLQQLEQEAQRAVNEARRG